MPQADLEIEKVVLGIMLSREDDLVRIIDQLTALDFYSRAHQRIFNAAADLYREGEPVNLVTLTNYIRDQGLLEEVGGAVYMTEILGLGDYFTGLKKYISILKDKALLRRIEHFGASIAQKASEPADGKALLAEMEASVLDLSQATADKKRPDVPSIMVEIEEDWRRAAAGEQVCIPASKDLFSDALPGYYPGHTIVIGGYTSSGKSTLLAQMVVDICRKGGTMIIFSMEDSRKEKIIKIIANITDIYQKTLLVGTLNDWQRNQIERAKQEITTWKLKIYDDVYDVDEMRLMVKKEKLRGPVDAIGIDFIQNIQGRGELYDRLADAAPKIHKMGKDLNLTPIVLSQVTNESMKGDSEIIPFKGAGEIAAAADLAFWIKRVKGEGKERRLECELKKNRPFGETGVKHLQFSKSYTRIEKWNPLEVE